MKLNGNPDLLGLIKALGEVDSSAPNKLFGDNISMLRSLNILQENAPVLPITCIVLASSNA